MNKRCPFVVIGAGSAGLVIAISLAKAGKKVLLIEKGYFGGDCTNYGCIPSKSLISSAKIAHHAKIAKKYGIAIETKSFSTEGALDRTRKIIEETRLKEDKQALEKHGVEVLVGKASFLSPYKILLEKKEGSLIIEAKKIILATGSSPKIPNIPNIETIDFLTNETIFDLKVIPKSLIILGGGPIGCELAQAYSRLGAKVTIVHTHETLLTKESHKAAKLLEKIFLEENINLYLNYKLESIEKSNLGISLTLKHKTTGLPKLITGEKLLISIGRTPNTSLNLEKAGIQFSEKGIKTNAYKQTSQKHIYAIGDCSGSPFFTHLAEHHARAVMKSLLLFRTKVDSQAIPRVTYTDPEIATIGLTEEDATPSMEIYHLSFEEIDRAICEGRTEGFITIITNRWSSKILGATIMGPRAGEMLMEISIAMRFNIPLRKLASIIHPYPIFNRGIRKISDFYYTKTLLPIIKNLFGK